MKLFPHQAEALEETKDRDRVAYYFDMGLGKTYIGSEKMMQLGADVNLVVCQKSKVEDWIIHFDTCYLDYPHMVYDCTTWDKKDWASFEKSPNEPCIMVINYELAFRRPALKNLKDFTLMLDESSMIQNEKAKRSKFILSLNAKNVILLSGTPTGGKYENLWSQCKLLGWPISKQLYWKQYIETKIEDFGGFPVKVVTGYKNVDRLKAKLREHGAVFKKTEEVLDLPEQIEQTIRVKTSSAYKVFRRDSIVSCLNPVNPDETIEIVGDTSLTKMLGERQLCGQYSAEKFLAFEDLLDATEDRLVVFYNFWEELAGLLTITNERARPNSVVNGKGRDLWAYENRSNSVTFIQYQAGAMGLNLQLANKIVYFSPTLSSELFEQSKKRIHRIGQNKTCFYYYMVCKNSVEEKIYNALSMRKDYTDYLFKEEE